MKNIFLGMSKEIYDKASQIAERQGITILDYVRRTIASRVEYGRTGEEPAILNNVVKLDFPVSDELHQKIKDFISQNNISTKALVEKCINEDAMSHGDRKERTFAFKLTENEQSYMKTQLRQRGLTVKEYISGLLDNEIKNSEIKQSELVTNNSACIKTLSFQMDVDMFNKVTEYTEILEVSKQNLTRSLIRKDLNFVRQNDEQGVQENNQSIGMRL